METIVFLGFSLYAWITLVTVITMFTVMLTTKLRSDQETWAAITWFSYLIYLHYRQMPTHKPRLALWVLLISFVLLQMCWWGINYLPSAQGSSVHVY